ncbi:MAG TPA: thioredoxin domain-containing protein, partial [Rhizomicrobium sp.]
IAALGAFGGAALALIVVFGVAALGMMPNPNRDEAIHAYLVSHPAVLVDMSNAMQAQQEASDDAKRQNAADKLGTKAFFDPRVAFVTGPADAKITMVEFFDYNCPYCRASVPAVRKFYAAHKNDARFAFIEFPIKGANSTIAARAAIAARNQPDKYLKFHFLLMNEEDVVTPDIIIADAKKAGLNVDKLKQDMTDKSVAAAIAASRNLATAAKVDGTPAFIVNGHMREGAVDDAALNQLAQQHV